MKFKKAEVAKSTKQQSCLTQIAKMFISLNTCLFKSYIAKKIKITFQNLKLTLIEEQITNQNVSFLKINLCFGLLS